LSAINSCRPIGLPVKREGQGVHPADNLMPPRHVDGDHLPRIPVEEPQSPLMPTWAFSEDNPFHQQVQLGHDALPLAVQTNVARRLAISTAPPKFSGREGSTPSPQPLTSLAVAR